MSDLKLLRCGWCGVFCDSEGRRHEALQQLVDAEEGGTPFEKGSCRECCGYVDTTSSEENKAINDIHRKVNKKLSTGNY